MNICSHWRKFHSRYFIIMWLQLCINNQLALKHPHWFPIKFVCVYEYNTQYYHRWMQFKWYSTWTVIVGKQQFPTVIFETIFFLNSTLQLMLLLHLSDVQVVRHRYWTRMRYMYAFWQAEWMSNPKTRSTSTLIENLRICWWMRAPRRNHFL